MKRLGLAEVRDNLSGLVNDAAHGGHRIVIESRGRPKAAIVGIADLERLEQIDAARQPASNPMLRWLDETEKLLRRQPAVTGSTLAALRDVREGAVAESHSLYRRERRPKTPRGRKR